MPRQRRRVPRLLTSTTRTTQSWTIPIWVDAQTGNTNSVQVQDALNLLTGPTVGLYEPGLDKIVTIPLYECVDNNIPQVHPGPLCPTPPVTSVGTNTSYRIVAWER